MAAKAFPLLNLLSEDIGGHQVTKGLLCEPDDPSVPLPLKSRQSSLVALQQIFDQINSNADTECGGLLGIRAQASTFPWHANPSSEHAMYLSELNKCPNRSQVSPLVSTPLFLQHASEIANLPLNTERIPQVMFGYDQSSPSLRQPCDQLTIFYSGNVHVYDNVPADKVNAIMLLAGSMSNSSYQEREVPQLQSSSSSPTRTVNMATGFNMPNKAPNSLANDVALSLSPRQTFLPCEHKLHCTSLKRPPPAAIELPHARKVSLARFLEKRKERSVKVQHGMNGVIKGDENRAYPNIKQCIS